ncbi:hypothetical protein AVEN_26300-1 [Araneus ventricosus]|uniref:Uncharacterized protein n=1 Tax=Araneus ventricosus TaxID=182803 RepID=A0A4Y2AM03_ARAVE|nr:hypothetical protein AVEN_26300-1 [Araneus ventricosus]
MSQFRAFQNNEKLYLWIYPEPKRIGSVKQQKGDLIPSRFFQVHPRVKAPLLKTRAAFTVRSSSLTSTFAPFKPKPKIFWEIPYARGVEGKRRTAKSILFWYGKSSAVSRRAP